MCRILYGPPPSPPPPDNAPTRPANAPPKRYSASTPPRNRSRSHTSPAQQACPGPGSTASPICEPTSTDSAELPQPRLSPFHHLNEDQPNRCYNALRPPSTRSPDSRPTTTSSENTSPSTSATGAKTASPPRQRHVSHMKPKLWTTTAPSPPDKHQQPPPSPAPNRPRLHQPHQLRSPRHPRDIMTPTGASNPQSHINAQGHKQTPMRRDLPAPCHPHITSAATVHLGDAPSSGSDACLDTPIIPHRRGLSADANPLNANTHERSGLGTPNEIMRLVEGESLLVGSVGVDNPSPAVGPVVSLVADLCPVG